MIPFTTVPTYGTDLHSTFVKYHPHQDMHPDSPDFRYRVLGIIGKLQVFLKDGKVICYLQRLISHKLFSVTLTRGKEIQKRPNLLKVSGLTGFAQI